MGSSLVPKGTVGTNVPDVYDLFVSCNVSMVTVVTVVTNVPDVHDLFLVARVRCILCLRCGRMKRVEEDKKLLCLLMIVSREARGKISQSNNSPCLSS